MITVIIKQRPTVSRFHNRFVLTFPCGVRTKLIQQNYLQNSFISFCLRRYSFSLALVLSVPPSYSETSCTMSKVTIFVVFVVVAVAHAQLYGEDQDSYDGDLSDTELQVNDEVVIMTCLWFTG